MRFGKGLLCGSLVAGLVGLMPGQAEALVLARYTFEDTAGTLSPDEVGFGIDASPVTFGSGGNVSMGGVFGGGFGVFQRTSTTAGALGSAISNQDYVSFVIDQGVGSDPFSVSSISYRHYLSDTNNGADYDSYLLTSETATSPGVFADGESIATGDIAGTGSSTDQLYTVSVDTSSFPELQNLTGPLEIRIYFSDDQAVPGHVHIIDDLTINGVPEPGTLALVALGGLCLVRRRRD